MDTAAAVMARQRTPEEAERAYRAFMEDVAASPWACCAVQLLECLPLRMLLRADGTIEPQPYPPDVQSALEQHELYVRAAALRHGFEVAGQG